MCLHQSGLVVVVEEEEGGMGSHQLTVCLVPNYSKNQDGQYCDYNRILRVVNLSYTPLSQETCLPIARRRRPLFWSDRNAIIIFLRTEDQLEIHFHKSIQHCRFN